MCSSSELKPKSCVFSKNVESSIDQSLLNVLIALIICVICSFLCIGMIGYGMAKAAVHQLCQSLSGDKGGLPIGAAAVAILPWVTMGDILKVLLIGDWLIGLLIKSFPSQARCTSCRRDCSRTTHLWILVFLSHILFSLSQDHVNAVATKKKETCY